MPHIMKVSISRGDITDTSTKIYLLTRCVQLTSYCTTSTVSFFCEFRTAVSEQKNARLLSGGVCVFKTKSMFLGDIMILPVLFLIVSVNYFPGALTNTSADLKITAERSIHVGAHIPFLSNDIAKCCELHLKVPEGEYLKWFSF